MTSIYKDTYFYLSADLALDLKVYIDHLETKNLPSDLAKRAEDLLVTVRILDGGAPLTAGLKSSHLPYEKGRSIFWNEWLGLPIKIRDLPKTAQLVSEMEKRSKLEGGENGGVERGGHVRSSSLHSHAIPTPLLSPLPADH